MRVTRSSARSGKKGKVDGKDSTNNAQSKDISILYNCILVFLQNHVSAVQKQVQNAMENKNVVVKELKICNDELRDELMKCKSTLNQKNNEIEILEKKKETFKMVTLAEVDKFSQNYQDKISNLEVANDEMRDRISKQENLLQEYEKQVEDLKSGEDDDEQKKNGKLIKKYKDLKGKVKTLDSMLYENKQQKNDLRKHIQAKDELIKLKDIEIIDLNKKLDQEKNKSVIISTLNTKIENLEDNLKSKEEAFDRIKSEHKEVGEQLERKNNDMEDKCKKIDELYDTIKAEKDASEKLEEGFQETLAELDGKIKDFEEKKNSICKENEDLRVDMKRLREASSEKDGSIVMLEKSISIKDVEISTLKLQKESNKQMLSSIIEKKNELIKRLKDEKRET